MKELQDNLLIMEKYYNKKLKESTSNIEVNYFLNKLEFVSNLRLILYANEDMEKFLENSHS